MVRAVKMAMATILGISRRRGHCWQGWGPSKGLPAGSWPSTAWPQSCVFSTGYSILPPCTLTFLPAPATRITGYRGSVSGSDHFLGHHIDSWGLDANHVFIYCLVIVICLVGPGGHQILGDLNATWREKPQKHLEDVVTWLMGMLGGAPCVP